MRTRLSVLLVPAQGAAAILALAVLAMWPPSAGRMLLVPIGSRDANAVARTAVAGGAMLLGAGPFAGSLVVVGDRSRIARRIRHWDIVIVAAPPAGCGNGSSFEGTA